MKKFYLSLFAFVGLISISATHVVYAGASEKTADYYRAHAEDNTGKKVTLDVAAVREVARGPESEKGVRMLLLVTYDEDNRASGGGIMALCDEKQYNSLVRRYGTSIEAPKKPEDPIDTKSLRGVLRVHKHKKGEGKEGKEGEGHHKSGDADGEGHHDGHRTGHHSADRDREGRHHSGEKADGGGHHDGHHKGHPFMFIDLTKGDFDMSNDIAEHARKCSEGLAPIIPVAFEYEHDDRDDRDGHGRRGKGKPGKGGGKGR